MLAHLKIWLKTQIKKSAGQPSAKWGLLSDILNSDHKWQRFHQHNPWKHLLNRFQYCWILLLRPMCDISTTTRCIWAPSSFIRPCPTPGDKRKRCMWYVTITNLLKPRPDDNQGCAPRPTPPRGKRAAPPRKIASLAPPRPAKIGKSCGAGQSWFESLENLNQQRLPSLYLPW